MSTCAQTVADYFAALRASDVERLVDLFVPNGESHDPVAAPPHIGHAALRQLFSAISARWAKLDINEQNVYVRGNAAAVRWTALCIERGGHAIPIEGIDIIECNPAGKILSLRAYWDPMPIIEALQR